VDPITVNPLIDLALGRTCHFCGSRDTRNVPVRRQTADAAAEALTVPLCSRHVMLLRSAGGSGRLHKPTATRWWLADGEAVPNGPPAEGCPASALLH
jgi:hypothetical protein